MGGRRHFPAQEPGPDGGFSKGAPGRAGGPGLSGPWQWERGSSSSLWGLRWLQGGVGVRSSRGYTEYKQVGNCCSFFLILFFESVPQTVRFASFLLALHQPPAFEWEARQPQMCPQGKSRCSSSTFHSIKLLCLPLSLAGIHRLQPSWRRRIKETGLFRVQWELMEGRVGQR